MLSETSEEAADSCVTGRLAGFANQYHHGGRVFCEAFAVDVDPVFEEDETFDEEEDPLDDMIEREAAF